MASVSSGQFTETIAVEVLKNAGAEFVILDSVEKIDENKRCQKLKKLLEYSLSAYVCVGNADLTEDESKIEALKSEIETLFSGIEEKVRENITLIYRGPKSHLSIEEWEVWIEMYVKATLAALTPNSEPTFKALVELPHFSTLVPPLMHVGVSGYYIPKGPLSIGLLKDLFYKLHPSV